MDKKVALVTGSNRGIGRAIALKLASDGYDIIVNYSRESSAASAQETVDMIKKIGVDALPIKCDVTSANEVTDMVKLIKDSYGRIDVLVNNAGITRDKLLGMMKEDDFDNVININLKGTFLVTKAVSKLMLKQRSGSIINVSSVIGVIGNAGQSNYAASKAGLIGFTKSLAKEFGSRSITVNAVAPGFIKTDMTEVLSDEVKKGLSDAIALKKLGEPEDVANAVSFLASENASYITGQVLNVCGGMVI